MRSNTYQSPTGHHRHICEDCQCVWEHSDDKVGDKDAHTCPDCGSTGFGNWWKHFGPEKPKYTCKRPKRQVA